MEDIGRLRLFLMLAWVVIIKVGFTSEDVFILVLELWGDYMMLRWCPWLMMLLLLLLLICGRRLVVILHLLPAWVVMMDARVRLVPLKGYWSRFQLWTHLLHPLIQLAEETTDVDISGRLGRFTPDRIKCHHLLGMEEVLELVNGVYSEHSCCHSYFYFLFFL